MFTIGGIMGVYWKLLGVVAQKVNVLQERYITKMNNNFLCKYGLKEGIEKRRTNCKYNPYEGSSILLTNRLIDSGAIKDNDFIMDVGCGAGIFLIQLHSRGFKNLFGVEIDKELYQIARENVLKYSKIVPNVNIHIKLCNAIKEPFSENINVFYFFNPFYDDETYIECFQQIKKSLLRKPRKVKLIFLYPTISVRIALEKCSWLKRLWRIHEMDYPCSKCMHFIVYENI